IASAATSAGPYFSGRKSQDATGVSVASMGCTVSSIKVGCEAESGAVAKKRANCAINVGSMKSRVQTRRYARLAMYGNYNRSGTEDVIGGKRHYLWRGSQNRT